MKKRVIQLTILMSLVFFIPACFNEEQQIIAFLEPDGSVMLLIYKHNVYSTEKTPSKRIKEEKVLLDRLLEERDIPLIKTLYDMGSDHVHIQVIRDTVPYEYLVKAQFDSFEDFFEALAPDDDLNLDIDVRLEGRSRSITITREASPALSSKSDKPNDKEEILFIIADAFDVESTGLRQQGENGVVLNPALISSVSIRWKMKPTSDKPHAKPK
ncbi:MAG: hypothetical protein GXO70_07510 [Acidobacteria bacterium]|nr:hypothetical protein [Acidobacteriota bacterium]